MSGLTRRDAIRLAGLGSCAAALFASRSLLAAEPAGGTPAASSSAAPDAAKGKAGAVAPVAGPNAQAAEAMFKEGFNCAQAVLSCCGKPYGLSREMGCRMGSGFVGGMAMMGLTCGSVTGAFMVIGLKHAQLDAKDAQPAGEANRLVREFSRRFTELHGSICCSELLGHDISKPEGLQAITAEGSFTKKCPILVRDAAALVEELLAAKAATPAT
jgi:C_GCAxxG_C_C family probable redox protein